MTLRLLDKKADRNAQSGYNLIGVSLFLLVLGIITTAGISLKQQYDWNKRQTATNTNMALVKTALMRYEAQNGRLPCPASLGDAMDNPNFGKERSCNSATIATHTFRDQGRGGRFIRYGAVPVRTLGLPDSAIVDGWDHRMVYAVTEYYAGPAADVNPDLDNGAISIVDASGTSTTNVDGNIIYTVMAPGADERGAYTLSGALKDPCTGTNCTAGDGRLQLSIFRQYNTKTSGSNNDFTATMTYTASAVSYEWRAAGWGDCSCCTHTQSRVVGCYQRGTQTVVADSLCANRNKPPLEQKCASHCWSASPWVTQASCGQTTQTRTVTCKQNDGQTVPDSLCTGVKLADSRPWNAGSCCGGGGGGSSSGGGEWGFYDSSGNSVGYWSVSSDGSTEGPSGSGTGYVVSGCPSCGSGTGSSGGGSSGGPSESLLSGGGSSCSPGSGAQRDPNPIAAPRYFVDISLDGVEDRIGQDDNLCVSSISSSSSSSGGSYSGGEGGEGYSPSMGYDTDGNGSADSWTPGDGQGFEDAISWDQH